MLIVNIKLMFHINSHYEIKHKNLCGGWIKEIIVIYLVADPLQRKKIMSLLRFAFALMKSKYFPQNEVT